MLDCDGRWEDPFVQFAISVKTKLGKCMKAIRFRFATPAEASLGKWGQSGETPARNTSNSAPVVKKYKSSIGFYPQGVCIIGVLALGPHFAILIFPTLDDRQMVPR